MVLKVSISDFLKDDSGAVTVDWVALTAGVLIIGSFIGYTVMTGAATVGTAMSLEMSQLSKSSGLTSISEGF